MIMMQKRPWLSRGLYIITPQLAVPRLRYHPYRRTIGPPEPALAMRED
jgi:hypothetical protein